MKIMNIYITNRTDLFTWSFYYDFSFYYLHPVLIKYNFVFFFTDACHNKECPFLHIDPETKVRDCPWYDRGFCRHGPLCRHRHVRRVLCMSYLAGFCPEGSACKFMQYVKIVLFILFH